MKKIIINTQQNKQIIDITKLIEQELPSTGGLCNLLVLHTTAALTTADLDPGTDLDMLDAFVEMVPKLNYRHPHNPDHVPDHIMSSIIGPQLLLPFDEGKLILGMWQRVIVVELDGPRKREIILSIIEAEGSN